MKMNTVVEGEGQEQATAAALARESVYFTAEGYEKAQEIQIANLLSGEPHLDAGRLARARERMDAARVGAGPKRKPLTVYRRADGRLVVVDGNTTLAVLKERNETSALANVVGALRQPVSLKGKNGQNRIEAEINALYALAHKAEPLLRKQVADFAARSGGEVHARPEQDGANLKSRARVREKAEAFGTATKVKDIVGFTLVYPDHASLMQALPQFEQDFGPVELKNRFDEPVPSECRNIVTCVRVKQAGGFIAEVRLTTAALFDAKENTLATPV